MPRKKSAVKAQTEVSERPTQMSFGDYHLKEVNVRLVLNEAPGLYSSTPIRDAWDAVNVMADAMRELDRENVCVINLDNKMRAVSYTVVSVGDICSSVVPVANVFKTAILANASAVLSMHTGQVPEKDPVSAVIMAHNHP